MNWTNSQYKAINEEGTNILVSAGAGSGKTAVLSERVLRKVKSGIDIRNILILTFTNEAALEMKERIRKKLKQNNLKEALEYIDEANITTFDAFALNLVKHYHDVLNISSKISIIDASIINLEKKKILNDIFLDYYKKKDKRFFKLTHDFSFRDDDSLKEAILSINNALDLKYDKAVFLENYLENFYKDDYLDNLIEEYFLYLKSITNLIEEDYYLLIDYLNDKQKEKLDAVIKQIIDPHSYDDIRIINTLDFPIFRNLEEDAKLIKDHLKESFNRLKELTIYKKEELKEQIISTKDYVSVIVDIITFLDKKINQYKKEKSAFEFVDIAKMAILIVSENKDICEELKSNYNEIMIDEYQDTNDLQELFISYIKNNNVYMVGDVKQSIYRFRNANPHIFRTKYLEYKKNNGGISIDLTENFRSRKEVLTGINDIFKLIMADAIGGINYRDGHEMVYGNKEYDKEKTDINYDMEILKYNNLDKEFTDVEIEAFTILKDIKEKLENGYLIYDFDLKKNRCVTYKDFCIILDRGTNMPIYKKIFEYFKVPLEVYQDNNLTSTNDFYLIKNIINIILAIYESNYDSNFRYSFTSVARSYLSELNDQEIFDILENNKIFETIIYQKCHLLRENIDNKTPFILLQEIIDQFDFISSSIKLGNILDCEIRMNYLLDLTKNMEQLGFTIKDFKDYLESITQEGLEIRYKEPKSLDSCVKIMNIHKSKGLEFPICYFAGLKKDFNFKDLQSRFMFDNNYGILTPYFKEGIDSTIIKELVRNHYYEEEIAEKIRLFYVALTRAKEKIIIVTPDLEKNYVPNSISYTTGIKYRSFYDFLNSISDNIRGYTKVISLEDIPLTHEYVYKIKKEVNIKESTSKIKFINYQNESRLIENKHASKTIKKIITKDELKTLEFGTLLHEKLELTDFKEKTCDKNIKDLQEKFDFNKATIYQEHEFITQIEGVEYHGIIDLMLEYDDTIKIIDYKLKNVEDKEYVEQLKVYYNYVSSISSKKVELYLYSIMDHKLKEIKVVDVA